MILIIMFTEERARWIYQHYRWLETHLPKRAAGKQPVLVTPTPEFYPQANTRNHAFAAAMFEATKELMELQNWKCRLSSQREDHADRDAALARSGVYGRTEHKGAAGTFQIDEEIQITYSPQLVHEPVALVATFSHELCHYLLATVKTEPPCGWKEHEPLTDLAAVHEGFGVFLCNSAFQFSQWTDSQYQGWKWRKQGYLTEAELGFALGVYCVRSGIQPDTAGKFLKMNPGEVFWDSIGYITELEEKERAAQMGAPSIAPRRRSVFSSLASLWRRKSAQK
ncbi:hypothetical protein [Opitutus sp. ER46]|uniref:hypothetical protein n=1 Tax=Opitutus sp. ER46 TaxID=2161864 RepID=UPI0011B1DD3B|nr:hypothetical protein [Opitutus sp. ER46]